MSEYRHGQDIQQGILGHIVKIDVSGHNGKHDAVRGNNGQDAVGPGDKHGQPGGDGGDAEHGPEEEGAGTRGKLNRGVLDGSGLCFVLVV